MSISRPIIKPAEMLLPTDMTTGHLKYLLNDYIITYIYKHVIDLHGRRNKGFAKKVPWQIGNFNHEAKRK